MEWNDPEGMAWIFREQSERIKWNSLEKGTEKERRRKFLEGRTLRKVYVNRTFTYLRKKAS